MIQLFTKELKCAPISSALYFTHTQRNKNKDVFFTINNNKCDDSKLVLNMFG